MTVSAVRVSKRLTVIYYAAVCCTAVTVYPCQLTALQFSIGGNKRDPNINRDMLFPLGSFAQLHTETRFGWWHWETVGSLIMTNVNENSQFTNWDTLKHMCACANTDAGAGHSNI